MASHITFSQLNKSDSRNQACSFFQGSTFTFGVQIAGDDGVPLDTTGYSLAGQFRPDYGSSKVYLTWQQSDGSIVNDPVNKTFWVTVHGPLTSSIRIADQSLDGVYDFELTAPDGTVDKALYGTASMFAEVTKV